MVKKKKTRPGVSVAQKLEYREREAKVWQSACLGVPATKIAKDMGIAVSTVYGILKRLEKKILAKMVDRAEVEKRWQTTALRHLLHEAICSWEKSKGEAGLGNLDYLHAARDVLNDLRKTWGVEINRTEHRGNPQVAVQVNNSQLPCTIPPDQLTVEELEEILAIRDRAKKRIAGTASLDSNATPVAALPAPRPKLAELAEQAGLSRGPA